MNHLNKGIVVEAPPIPPNWMQLMFYSIFSFTMFRIIDSNVFEAIGVREIGLTYFSIVFGGFTFGTGITIADFLVSGIIPSRNELLKIAVRGPARILYDM